MSEQFQPHFELLPPELRELAQFDELEFSVKLDELMIFLARPAVDSLHDPEQSRIKLDLDAIKSAARSGGIILPHPLFLIYTEIQNSHLSNKDNLLAQILSILLHFQNHGEETIYQLNLPTYTLNALKKARIHTLSQLNDIILNGKVSKVKWIGPEGMQQIIAALEEFENAE